MTWTADSSVVTADSGYYLADGSFIGTPTPPVPGAPTIYGRSLMDYISTTWPYLWTFDNTMTMTFDSTDTQWTFDGGQVRGGGIVTRQDTNPIAEQFTRLSVTRTENLRF